MNATLSAPTSTDTTQAPVTPETKPAKATVKFSAMDSVRASVDLSNGPLAFVTVAVDNAQALGLPVGNIDRSKLASAIGRALAESRDTSAKFNAKGGKASTVESFDWASLAKAGLLTPLQATTLAAVGAIAASVDKVRRARNASL